MSGLILPSYATGFAQGMLSDIPWAWEVLVGAWSPSLGATGRQLRDWSGKYNPGTLEGDAHFVPGPGGTVLEFDGTGGDKIGLGNILNFGDGSLDSPFSIVAFVNMRDATNFEILTKANNTSTGTIEWVFEVSDGDQLRFTVYDNAAAGRRGRKTTATLEILEGQWVQFAGTYDGSSAEAGFYLYINGVEVTDYASNSNSAYTAMHNTGVPAEIGVAFSAGTPRWADGQISDTLVYNCALLPIQIKELYERQKQLVNV